MFMFSNNSLQARLGLSWKLKTLFVRNNKSTTTVELCLSLKQVKRLLIQDYLVFFPSDLKVANS